MQAYKGPWATSATKIPPDDIGDALLPKLEYALRRDGVADDDMLYFSFWSEEYKLFLYVAFSRQHVLMPPIEPWTPKKETSDGNS